MDLARYVEELRNQLLITADAGGDDARALAERLTATLDSATRVVLLDALSSAADEITRDLAPGSVDVRLRGRDAEFVVTAPAGPEPEAPGPVGPGESIGAGAPEPAAAGRPTGSDGDEGGTARITLRLPEQLKVQIEDAAGRDGVSVNAWLVRAIAGAVGTPTPASRAARPATATGQRLTGWAR